MCTFILALTSVAGLAHGAGFLWSPLPRLSDLCLQLLRPHVYGGWSCGGPTQVYLAVVEKIAPDGGRWQADELRLRISAPHSLAFASVLVETFTSFLLHFLTRCNKVRDHNFCKSCNLDFLGNIWISFGDLSWPFTGHWIGHRSLIWTGEVKMLWEWPGSWSDSIKFSYLKILENFTIQLLNYLINKKTMWVLFLWTAKYY